MTYNKKTPKGFTHNGTSFNEYAVASMSEQEFIDSYKSKHKGSPFFGKRDDAKQTALLKETYALAKAQVEKQAPKEPEQDLNWTQIGEPVNTDEKKDEKKKTKAV